jgi:flavin reductase (DIM6/NTAB) family NADH-FMN oxidoreductase RutF
VSLETQPADRLSSVEFRAVVGHLASGVTVITSLDGDAPCGTTASAVTSLSDKPPMMLVCLNKGSATGRAVTDTGCLAINVLSEDQTELALRFATKASDKFEGVPWSAGRSGLPLLAGALARLECEVVERVTGGTHTIFLAEVCRASASGDAPLAYFRGRFGRLELAVDESQAGVGR